MMSRLPTPTASRARSGPRLDDVGVVLRTDGLTKRFGRVLAVDRLDIEVREGEVFGFLGPNGA